MDAKKPGIEVRRSHVDDTDGFEGAARMAARGAHQLRRHQVSHRTILPRVLLRRKRTGVARADAVRHRHRPVRPSVGFVRLQFLPPSETFVYRSLAAIKAYQVRVFTLKRRCAQKFPHADVVRPPPVEAAIFRATTWSPTFLRWARTVRVLHAHHGQTAAHCLWAAHRARLPLVVSYYGLDATILDHRGRSALADPRFWHYRALARRIFAEAARFVVLSRHMAARLIRQGCPEDRIRIVRLGVDLDRFVPASGSRREPGALRVLLVGREIQKKGFDDGLRACALARDEGIRIEVTVLGTGGPLKAELRRLGRSLGLDVRWPPEQADVAAAMREADVLLVPSRTGDDGDEEGTPTVICEGGASGLPVVATLHAGIPEQIDDGETGLLAPERSPAHLAAHLVRLARDPELSRRMGAAARAKMADEYSLSAHGARLEAIYGELLGGGTAS